MLKKARRSWWLWFSLWVSAAGAAVPSGYAGSAVCGECHDAELKAWSGSHHALAMAKADAQNVRGDFNDARFEYAGVQTQFFRRDGSFHVRTDGPDGKPAEYPLAYTFGVTPLQQYLIAFPGGRYQALGIAWDSRPKESSGQRWFHLYPGENITASDPLHWTGPYQRWNSRCAECHSTGLDKGFERRTGSWKTRWAEISVGCEACHGPGQAHVDAARRGAKSALPVDPGRAGSWAFAPGARIAAPLGESAQGAQLAVCAPCHSRRQNIADFRPGGAFLDAHVPALLETSLYYPDGQIREEVFEYGSFLQSRMAQRGVTCTDCHDAHSMRLRAEGNATCHRCHQPAVFDTPEHHRHEPGSDGAQCVNCHMASRTYMVVDPRRDHGFRVPDPWLNEEAQSPDVCTACHKDRDNAWAQAAFANWGIKRSADAPQRLLALSRKPSIDGVRAGRRLASDAGAPPMQRATALAELRVVAQSDLQLLATALREPEPLLRLGAAQALAGVPVEYAREMAWPLLDDDARAVRLEATLLLASVPDAQLSQPQREKRQRAIGEYIDAQHAAADLAGGPMNIAALELARGHLDEAEKSYREALTLEPALVAGWLNLADLHRARGDEGKAGEALARALAIAPEAASVHHALGLHLVRSGQQARALEELALAQTLAPGEARYAYVLGVALHSAGRDAEAIAVTRTASKANPIDASLLQLLASLYRDQGQMTQAATAMRQFEELNASLAK
jgi:tetratricopeptide (TPR) repeat protein